MKSSFRVPPKCPQKLLNSDPFLNKKNVSKYKFWALKKMRVMLRKIEELLGLARKDLRWPRGRCCFGRFSFKLLVELLLQQREEKSQDKIG